MGEEIHHQAEPQDPQHELEHAHNQRQNDRVADKRFTAHGCQRRKSCRGHERDNRDGPGGKLPAGAKERRQERRQQRGIQSILDGHASQLRIGHGLRDQD